MSKNLYHARTELCPDIQWPMWYKLSIESDEDNFMDIPEDSELLTNNGISMVWRGNNNFIYKQSIPFLIENEIYFLRSLWPKVFLPAAQRLDKYTIALQDLGESEMFTDPDMANYLRQEIINKLLKNVRHGDLTRSNVIIRDNRPYIIDWAEARFNLQKDPRKMKRRMGDDYHLRKTFEELCEEKE